MINALELREPQRNASRGLGCGISQIQHIRSKREDIKKIWIDNATGELKKFKVQKVQLINEYVLAWYDNAITRGLAVKGFSLK